MASHAGYNRCGKCRLFIDRTGRSKLTRVCRCASAPDVSVHVVIRSLRPIDSRPLWQRALERRQREKLDAIAREEERLARLRSVEHTATLHVSLGDLARFRG